MLRKFIATINGSSKLVMASDHTVARKLANRHFRWRSIDGTLPRACNSHDIAIIDVEASGYGEYPYTTAFLAEHERLHAMMDRERLIWTQDHHAALYDDHEGPSTVTTEMRRAVGEHFLRGDPPNAALYDDEAHREICAHIAGDTPNDG